MARILNRVAISADIEDVFSFVTSPASWVFWHPSTIAVHGCANHPLLLGEQVVEEFRALGRRHCVRWGVIEHVPPRRWAVQGIGEYLSAARLTYTFEQSGHVTVLSGEFVYRLPNLLLSLLGSFLIQRRFVSESEEAARKLKMLLENDAPERPDGIKS